MMCNIDNLQCSCTVCGIIPVAVQIQLLKITDSVLILSCKKQPGCKVFAFHLDLYEKYFSKQNNYNW